MSTRRGTKSRTRGGRKSKAKRKLLKPKPPVERLERCTISIDDDGQLVAVYKWSHIDVEGSMAHDEDVSTWTDEEILQLVSELIGVENEDDRKVMVIER